MHLLATFNLKAGTSVEAYESWAKTVDLPTVKALPSINSFRVFRITGLFGSEASPPFGYAELIEVNDMDRFLEDVATPAMQEVAAQFGGMVEVTFMTAEELGA
jgi:hypothetical protein